MPHNYWKFSNAIRSSSLHIHHPAALLRSSAPTTKHFNNNAKEVSP